MQLGAGAADLLGEPALDVHVNVFIRRRELELAAGDLALDGRQAADNFLRIPQGNNPLLAEHLGMGDAAHDVMAVQTRIDGDGRGKGLDGIGGATAEPAAPEFFFRLIHDNLRQWKIDNG